MAEDTAELASAARKYWSAEGYSPGGVMRKVDYAAAPRVCIPACRASRSSTATPTSPRRRICSPRARRPSIKDKVPGVRRVNGVDRWFVGDRDFGTLGGNVISADNNKLLGRLAFPTIEEGHKGAHDTKQRLQAMDDMGVYAQICYPELRRHAGRIADVAGRQRTGGDDHQDLQRRRRRAPGGVRPAPVHAGSSAAVGQGGDGGRGAPMHRHGHQGLRAARYAGATEASRRSSTTTGRRCWRCARIAARRSIST